MASVEERLGPDGKPRYVARYRTPEGKSKSKTFLRQRQAVNYLTTIEHDKLTGSYVDPRLGQITVRQYGEEWLAAQMFDRATSERRVKNALLCLYGGLGGRPLGHVRRIHVEVWLKSLKGRYEPNTVRTTWGWTRTLFLAAVQDRLIPYSPCDGVRLRLEATPPIVPPTVEQVQGIHAYLPARWRDLALVGAQTGLRPSELLGLCKDQLTLMSRTPYLTVNRQLQVGQVVPYTKTKNSFGRRVPLDAGTVEIIAAHLATHPPGPDGRLFPVNNPRRSWAKAVAKAGIERQVRMHDLRHFYASQMLAETRDFQLVADCLGDTVATTMRVYAHLLPIAQERGVGVMDRVFARLTVS